MEIDNSFYKKLKMIELISLFYFTNYNYILQQKRTFPVLGNVHLLEGEGSVFVLYQLKYFFFASI